MLQLIALMQAAATPVVGLPLPEAPHWLERPTVNDFEAARPKDLPGAGDALALCQVTPEGRLASCTIEEETPAGQGVGAAVLALTAKYRMAPVAVTDGSAGGYYYRIRLRFHPLPPPLPPGVRLITKPKWINRPTGEVLAQYYPDRARRMDVTGQAVAQCVVDADGRLGSCVVLDESPLEYGFGEAVLRMMPLMQMEPLDEEGLPVAGAAFRFPMNFTLPGH